MKLKEKTFFIISVLGSGNGKANQTFNYSVFPEDIWIRKSPEEPVRRWHPVKDFSESDKDSEHYSIDRDSGEIRFGDGKNGMVPSAGCIIIGLYRTSGGAEDILRARRLVVLRGLGKGFDGLYYVEPVSHTINSNGYVSKFNIERKEEKENGSIKRNGYFYGKLLTADDFKTEQQYFLDKKNVINKAIEECRRESCLMSILLQIMKSLSWKMEGTISISVTPNKKIVVEKEPLQSLIDT